MGVAFVCLNKYLPRFNQLTVSDAVLHSVFEIKIKSAHTNKIQLVIKI